MRQVSNYQMKDQLLNYVIKQQQPDQFIKNHMLSRLFVQELESINMDLALTTKHMIASQKEKNRTMRKEMVNLAREFDKRDLTILFFKGISLADDLYSDAPEIRKANDIDVLVSIDRVQESLDLMGELSYYLRSTNEVVSAASCMKYYDQVIQDRIHFPEFQKRYGNISIDLDFHISIIHTLENKPSIMRKMIHRHAKQTILGYNVSVFDIHDRILNLIAHISKEYFRNLIRWHIAADRTLKAEYFPMHLLHDIALAFGKYSINWSLLYEYADELQMLDELLLFYKVLNYIYKDLIPKQEIDKLTKMDIKKAGYLFKQKSMFYPLSLCLELDPEIIIHKSVEELSTLIMSQLIHAEQTFKLSNMQQSFHIIQRSTDDMIQGVQIVRQANNAFSELVLNYNEASLSIKIKIPQDYRLAEFPIDLLFAFYQYNKLFRGYIVQMRCFEDKGEIQLLVSNIYIQFVFLNKLSNWSDQDWIYLEIPWEVLGIVPNCGFKFLFDLEFTGLLRNTLGAAYAFNKIMVDSISALKDRITYLYSPAIFNEVILT